MTNPTSEPVLTINSQTKVKLRRTPRYKNAPDKGCIWSLSVNGYTVGTYYGGKELSYENPEKWAKKQVTVRLKVLDRNILRLTDELNEFKKEHKALTEFEL